MSFSLDKLLRDTLFQLNVLVALCADAPTNSLVRPALKERGFQLESLDRALHIDQQVLTTVRNEELNCGQAPEPDATLWNPISKTRILVECKAQSFSPPSSNSRQGRALLLAAGQHTKYPFDPVPSDVLASYFLPETSRKRQEETLQELSDELNRVIFPQSCGNSMVLALSKSELGEISLHASKANEPFTDFPPEGLPIVKHDPDELPVPLYRIAICPDALDGSKLNSGFSNIIFFYKLVSQLVQQMHGQEADSEVGFSTDQVLHNLVAGLSLLWSESRRRPIRKFTHKAIHKVLKKVTTHKSIESITGQSHTVCLAKIKFKTLRNRLENLLELPPHEAGGIIVNE